MKRILITGQNSYIGSSFVNWMKVYERDYQFDTIDLKDSSWRNRDFSIYNSIIHLAAIVHVKVKSEAIYYQVNRDLAVEVAKKALKENVQQFIFFSTMSVFGKDTGTITEHTIPKPNNPYGKSKREAELLLTELQSDNFKVAVVRPPMIYGPHAVGNYQRLSKLANKTKLFPKVYNKRSMLFSENLFRFIKICLDNELHGIFHPQNSKYVNTTELVKQIAIENRKNIFFVRGCSSLINILSKKFKFLNKVFGSLTYDKTLSGTPDTYFGEVYMDYASTEFETSIRLTENKDDYQ
ncbi:NAD-dependent epimerase/dehydratase family protein [Enterococcus casseliflavus]|uniref:NAD-dependent epimerase/dehydratase family protein n=1 Tax=Enterococcus casseliflavus TaxID=37734 RepID=UPI0029559FFE|nr:NAD-dependent epimerase/dehydratase family protein [Enterococcus casseliflavus]MDV7702654.1 NAD-dependent epimerase/dehydratase family protein [Enterococcus casseliflavus]